MALFSLEAVFAKKGDALILHYGDAEDPKMILIDGGPSGVFKSFLKPRFAQLREDLGVEDSKPLPFEMVMVSHIDDDHINGILEFFRENEEAKRTKKPAPYVTKTLWHNSFEDLLGKNGSAAQAQVAAATAAANGSQAAALPNLRGESQAVVASTAQGRDLRDLARKLNVKINHGFTDLVEAPAKTLAMHNGLSFTVVGPDKGRIAVLRKQWEKDLAALKSKKKTLADTATFSDNSPYNLASICVLAKVKTKTMLLTGDARGDFLLEGLQQAKLITAKKGLHLDLLKVPHHGSDRNVETSFFAKVTADHYVMSGDGEHDNPAVETLEMIRLARGKDRYTIHFTITSDAHKTETNAKRKKALAAVNAWVQKKKPKNCTCLFQAPDTKSVLVDLLDPLFEE